MAGPFVALAGIPFLLLVAVFLYYGGPLAVGLLRRRLQCRTVEATVVESAVTEREDWTFEPTVRFRYRFDGRGYESTEVREGESPPIGPRRVAESFVEPYPAGETVLSPRQRRERPRRRSWRPLSRRPRRCHIAQRRINETITFQDNSTEPPIYHG